MNPCMGHRQFWGMLPWEFALSWCQDKSLVCFRGAGRYGHGTGLPNAPGQGEPSVPPENQCKPHVCAPQSLVAAPELRDVPPSPLLH